MDISQWFNYYSFVMGDLLFGKSFNMLVDDKDAYVLKQLLINMRSIKLFSHMTWPFPFFKRISRLNAEYLKFRTWVGERVKSRIQVCSISLFTPSREEKGKFKYAYHLFCVESSRSRRCFFSFILKANEEGPKARQDTLNLHGDAYLIIVPGRYRDISSPLRETHDNPG